MVQVVDCVSSEIHILDLVTEPYFSTFIDNVCEREFHSCSIVKMEMPAQQATLIFTVSFSFFPFFSLFYPFLSFYNTRLLKVTELVCTVVRGTTAGDIRANHGEFGGGTPFYFYFSRFLVFTLTVVRVTQSHGSNRAGSQNFLMR